MTQAKHNPKAEQVQVKPGKTTTTTSNVPPTDEAVAVNRAMVRRSMDARDPGGRNFLDLAKRLLAVPKDEIDRLRHEGDDAPQPE